MSVNQFFEKKGPFPLKEILNTIGYNGKFSQKNDFKIHGFESLDKAYENDLTFLNSSKYQNLSLKTKAAACITSQSLSKFLPDKCIKIDVKNVLFAVTQVSRMFYPKADIDYPDENLCEANELKALFKRSKSHDLTTLPCCQREVILAKSRLNSFFSCRISIPSAIDCIIPYSIPL